MRGSVLLLVTRPFRTSLTHDARPSSTSAPAASARSSCHEGFGVVRAVIEHSAPTSADRTHPPPLSHGCGCLQRFRRGTRSGRAAQAPRDRRSERGCICTALAGVGGDRARLERRRGSHRETEQRRGVAGESAQFRRRCGHNGAGLGAAAWHVNQARPAGNRGFKRSTAVLVLVVQRSGRAPSTGRYSSAPRSRRPCRPLPHVGEPNIGWSRSQTPTDHHAPHARKTNRRLAKFRVGAEGRISHLKRRYGPDRSRLKGHTGARTWAAWAILAYNLDTLALRAA